MGLERDHYKKLQRPNVFPYAKHAWVNELIARAQAKRKASTYNKEHRGEKEKQRLPFIFAEHVEENKYPSSKWQTEKQVRYKVIDFSRTPQNRAPFLVTRLDERYHNPQSKQIFHIRRINDKPVCSVHTWKNYPEKEDMQTLNKTIYTSSFEQPKSPEQRILVKSEHFPAEGIVPFNQPEDKCNVREEMFLPVCETIRIPSAPNPHRYLLRKRKVPAPHQPMGVFYPDSPSPDPMPERPVTQCEKISISTLCGQEFTRRKYIPQPRGNFVPGAFDGGAPLIETHRFDEKYLPLVKVPPII